MADNITVDNGVLTDYTMKSTDQGAGVQVQHVNVESIQTIPGVGYDWGAYSCDAGSTATSIKIPLVNQPCEAQVGWFACFNDTTNAGFTRKIISVAADSFDVFPAFPNVPIEGDSVTIFIPRFAITDFDGQIRVSSGTLATTAKQDVIISGLEGVQATLENGVGIAKTIIQQNGFEELSAVDSFVLGGGWLEGYGSLVVCLYGTWAGKLEAQISVDGFTTLKTVTLLDMAGLPVNEISENGFYNVGIPPMVQFRVIVTELTSGSVFAAVNSTVITDRSQTLAAVTSLPTYATRVDEVSSSISYVGKAATGADTSLPLWQIQKIDTSSGLVLTWADGDSKFDNVWDDRAGLTFI